MTFGEFFSDRYARVVCGVLRGVYILRNDSHSVVFFCLVGFSVDERCQACLTSGQTSEEANYTSWSRGG